MRTSFGWNQLRFAVAALLLAAAATKVVDTPRILSGEGLLGSPPRLVFVIAFEAAAGVWIAVGDRFLSWIVTLVVFGVFVLSTAYAIVTGQSCNCFGSRVDARAMLILDLCVLLTVAGFRPIGRSIRSGWLPMQMLIAVVVGGAFAGMSVWKVRTTDRTEPLEFLLAQSLIGKAWLLDERFHPDLRELHSDRRLIVVVREECEHCQAMMMRHFDDPRTHRPGERTAMFVAGNDEWPFQFDRVCFERSGDGFITWPGGEPFVASPAVFVVEDGVVMQAADGDEADGFLETLFRDGKGLGDRTGIDGTGMESAWGGNGRGRGVADGRTLSSWRHCDGGPGIDSAMSSWWNGFRRDDGFRICAGGIVSSEDLVRRAAGPVDCGVPERGR